MTDLHIEQLRLAFDGVDGHLHRIRPICRRAAVLLGELATERPLTPPAGATSFRRLEAQIELDLTAMSDEQASRRIAESMHGAIKRTLASGTRPAARPAAAPTRAGRTQTPGAMSRIAR